MSYKLGSIVLGASLLALSTTRAQASDDTPLLWYASQLSLNQTASQYLPWENGEGWDSTNIMRAGSLFAALSAGAYDRQNERDLQQFGLEEVIAIAESRTISKKDAGKVIQIATNLPSAIVGGNSIAGITPSAYAYVAQTPGQGASIVSVRGTNDFDDALLDANTATISADGVLYHHGFYIYSALLYDRVRAALGACTQPIWLTGHSLGGASAQVLAYWLRNDGCNVQGVVTFGAPAPGRTNFASAYNAAGLGGKTHRFEGEHDIVVCTPLGPNWGRVGSQHVVTRDNEVRLFSNANICDGIGEGFEASAYGFFMAAHDALDVVPEAVDWIRAGLESAGLCHSSNTVKRVLIGLFTGGASELTCKSIDDASDIITTADQVRQLSTVLFAGKVPRDHAIAVYRSRIDAAQIN